MKPESENIEEKLIPYLEGVLNAKERREVEEAINTDSELAREMSELRELILELRQGFATGLKPPQEELSIDEVVELSAHTGSHDKLPGSSAQKARLFCSDGALEEYSLLRALSEEMAKTTLDRENIPEMPNSLRQEFAALKGDGQGKKVLPFLKPSFASSTPTVPLWRRASSWLDRIDPKPLMASAAALVMLSLGVHLYNRPATAPADSSRQVASAVVSSTLQPSTLEAGMEGAAAPSPGIEGVAVFTSDDTGLLKEQAEKLLAKKVRYTVTKDRILVSEKDVAVAREILWEDAEGKAVAMAKVEGEPAARKSARTVSSDEGSASERFDVSPFQDSERSEGDYLAPESVENVTVYSSARRSDAPPPVPRGSGQRVGSKAASSSYSSGGSAQAELEQGLGKARGESVQAPSSAAAPEPPPAPSRVVLPATPSEVVLPTQTDRSGTPGSVAPPISEARRQKLRDLALGEDSTEVTPQRPSAGASLPSGAPLAEEATGVQLEQGTAMETRARVGAPVAPVAAPAPTITKMDEVQTRLERMQALRQKTAQKNGVELSFERQDDKIVVYVRPDRLLDKAQLDELRKLLRKELGLVESDTLIFR